MQIVRVVLSILCIWVPTILVAQVTDQPPQKPLLTPDQARALLVQELGLQPGARPSHVWKDDHEPQGDIRLVYPWVSNNAGSFDSIVVVNNLTQTAADIWLTARRANGDEETVKRTVAPFGFLEESSASLFPNLGSGAGYAITVQSESPQLYGRWVTNSLIAPSGQSPAQGVAARVNEYNENNYIDSELRFGLLPNNENALAALVVVPLDLGFSFGGPLETPTLTFFDSAGDVIRSEAINLTVLEPFTLLVSDWIAPSVGDVSVHLTWEGGGRGTSPGTATGSTFVFDATFAEPAIGNATRFHSFFGTRPEFDLLFPWVSNRAGQYRSTLVINNPHSNALNLALTATRGDGTPTATVSRVIPARGFLKESAASLFPTLGDGAGYSVRVHQNSPAHLMDGLWLTENLAAESGASPSIGVGVRTHMDSQVGERLLFGYLPLDNAYVSVPVLLNTGDEAIDVRLQFYDANGQLLLDDTTTAANLLPDQPRTVITNDLIPANSGNIHMVASVMSGAETLTGMIFVFNGEFNEPALGNAEVFK